ncbi:TRAP transporter large permease subunit [Xanthobacteraceae bacterium Astr-EGSB]|nr:TRAP transporter large permease subunit [Xanthobacteraceae bacterium Astr-EGSB]
MVFVTTLGLLFGLLGVGIWVSLSLMGVGAGTLLAFRSLPVDKVLAQAVWNGLTSSELVALPMFILMAEFLFRSKFTANLFRAVEPWVRNLPGGLLHANIVGCTLFAAISGSSAATTMTVGRITLKELFSRDYDRSLAIGSLAGAGTLGFLIPPSLIFIIYGVLSQTSILKLFAAGIVPGLLLAGSFAGYLFIRALWRPVVPARQDESGNNIWRERFLALPYLLPFVILMFTILGSMYGGLASPTEAAAVGIAITLTIMALEGSLTRQTVLESCLGSARTASMLGLIIGAAFFLSVAMGYLGLPKAVAAQVAAMNVSPFMLIVMLLGLYIVLGCFLEGMSIIVMTLPITLPLVNAAGFSTIWYGVFLVIAVEMAQVTPPVGFNLYVIQGLTGESIGRIARDTLPFFLIMLVFTLLLALAPEIVDFLPNHM